MKSNRGFTLMELMVVVVIIGILAAVIGLSVSMIGGTSAKKAAAQMNSYLSTVRSNCMSRAGSPYALIYVEDDIVVGEYFEYEKPVEKDTITDKRVTVTYGYGTNKSKELGTSDKALKVSFARSTGALKEPIQEGKLKFTISGGGRTYTVTVIAVTGNHEVDS